MSFGDRVSPASTLDSAAWIDSACDGDSGRVGWLVPSSFESVVRVPAPTEADEWWALYRDLFGRVAEIADTHTSTPDKVWFGIWEGHGFDSFSSGIAYSGPTNEEVERQLEQRRAELKEEDRRLKAEIRAGLERYVLLERPDRSYYLMKGRLSALSGLTYPGSDGWRNPDLVWPDDRQWFIGTDVDFWSLFIGGTKALAAELAEAFPGSEPVSWSDILPIEN